MSERKLTRVWATLNSMPMPAIASDRLVDLHNDLTHYDTTIAEQMDAFLTGKEVQASILVVDMELEDDLRAFKPEHTEEVECRREMLRYKRKIDEVIRELHDVCSEKK